MADYTQLLQLGIPTTIKQNVVYALPALRCFLSCTESSPTLKVANDVAMTAAITLTLDSNKEANLAHGFIQATDADHLIILRSY